MIQFGKFQYENIFIFSFMFRRSNAKESLSLFDVHWFQVKTYSKFHSFNLKERNEDVIEIENIIST